MMKPISASQSLNIMKILVCPFTATDFKNYVTSTYTGNNGPAGSPPPYPAGTVDKVLARYPLFAYPTPGRNECGGNGWRHLFRVRATKAQSYHRRVRCRSTHMSSTIRLLPSISRRCWFPGHSPMIPSDIQYLFPFGTAPPDGIPHKLNKLQEALSDALVAAWTNFAWTGNPNGLGNGPWPRYRLDPKQPTGCRRTFQACRRCRMRSFTPTQVRSLGSIVLP